MIVCVETNFILELAFLREEHESCLEILGLAKKKQIRLKLPAFSIGESYEAIERAHKGRRELRDKLVSEINEMARSKPRRETSEGFLNLASLLIKSIEEERHNFANSLDLLNDAEIIPTGVGVVRAAISYQETLKLSPQDSTVYASVIECLSSLSGGDSCFITKDNDFGKSDIQSELADYNCKVLTGKNAFKDGLSYIDSLL